VPDRNTGDCLDPELSGTGLQTRAGREEGEAEAGPGLPVRAGEDLLEPSRDGGNMMEDNKESIRDVMRKDQQPTE
jgi:hypothetical protein